MNQHKSGEQLTWGNGLKNGFFTIFVFLDNPKHKNMKISIKICILPVIMGILMVSCQSATDSKDVDLAPTAHKVKAEEVIQTTSYTYVRVSADGRDYWTAINKADIREGNTYYWSVGTEMKEFTSKELKRTFRSIVFIQDFTDKPITSDQPPPMNSMGGKQQAPQYTNITVPKAEGGVTVAELFSKKSSLAGKTVKVRGQVVKFSAGIMNKNWVHIQDGTKEGENYDLAVTTLATVNVGDVVVFEGVVGVDKDFGAGYFYSVILENAVVKN